MSGSHQIMTFSAYLCGCKQKIRIAMISLKDNRLDNLRFFLIIMVVFLHAYTTNEDNAVDLDIINTIYRLGKCAVPSFFFISGYLFFVNYDVHKWKQKISSRFKTLFIPYVLWNCITCILWFVVYKTLGTEYTDPENFPPKILDAVVYIFEYSPLWYVLYLFIYVLSGRVLYEFIRNRNLGLFILCPYLVTITCIAFPYFNLLYWLPFFLLGGFVSIHYKDSISQGKGRQQSAIILLWIILYAFDRYLSYSTITTLLRIASPFFVFALYDCIDKYRHIRQRHIYKYSFFLYSFHYVLLRVGQRWCLLHYGEHNPGVLVAAVLVPVLVIALCILTAYMLDRKCNRLYSLLVGSR